MVLLSTLDFFPRLINTIIIEHECQILCSGDKNISINGTKITLESHFSVKKASGNAISKQHFA